MEVPPCLTVRQPWAHAIAVGLKRFETRGWHTMHRGPVLIHAGQAWDEDGRLFHRKACGELLAMPGLGFKVVEFSVTLMPPIVTTPPLGAIVAIAELVDCHPAEDLAGELTEVDRYLGNFAPGRFAFRLASVRRLKDPVRCRGLLRFWKPSRDVLDRVRKQIDSP